MILLSAVSAVFSQKPDPPLATANGKTYTTADLSPEAQKLYESRDTLITDARKQLLGFMINERLLDIDAAARGVSAESLTAAVKAKVPPPTEAQIKAVYDANRRALGDNTIEQARRPIVEFIRRDAEQEAVNKYLESLKTKYKTVYGRDINAPDLRPIDLLAAVDGKSISAEEFENKYKLTLYDTRADAYDKIRGALEDQILADLINAEAAAQKIEPTTLIANEITNKLRDFSDDERAARESAFKKGLFEKYSVKMLLKEPEPVVQAISVDDDPAQGPVAAPVTVVMFNDFECPACAATHPVLKKVLAEYAGKIRFVVRDFPLTTIHKNAFNAARAANAANAQGKFFEYAELLYAHQNDLDDTSLKKYAADLGLNVKQFEIDFSLEKTAAEVRKDMADGKAYGLTGTPTVFVNGLAVRRLSAEGFRGAIDRALKKN